VTVIEARERVSEAEQIFRLTLEREGIDEDTIMWLWGISTDAGRISASLAQIVLRDQRLAELGGRPA
jgi:hypothetical protein